MKNRSDWNFWQRFAKFYGPVMKHSDQVYDVVARKMRPRMQSTMDVLEVACGTGQISFRLGGTVRLWEATDFSPAMIELAKKENTCCHLRFSVQDATKLPYGTGIFDAVVIANALHILPHPELALAEAYRVLKPGGVLYAPTFIRSDSPAYKIRVRLLSLLGFHTYSQWSGAELLDFLKAHRFVPVDSQELGPKKLPLYYVEAKKAPCKS